MTPGRHGSIAALVVVLIVVTVSALLAIAGTFAYRYYSDRQWAAFQQAQAVGADQFQIAVAPAAWSLDYPQITKLMESRLRDNTVAGLLVELDGRQMGLRRSADGSIQAQDTAFDTQGLLLSERPIEFSGQHLGSARIYATPALLEEELRVTLQTFAAFGVLVALILSLALYVLLSRLVVRPLKLVERYAGEVARGEHQPTALQAHRFIGELEGFKRSIDSMVRELEARNQELATAKERFERVIRLFPVPISLFDLDGRITYLNDCFIQTYGYTLTDIPDIERWTMVAYPDPDHREEARAAWEQQRAEALQADGQIQPKLYLVTGKDGSIRNVEVSGILAPGVNIGLLADVSERVRAEQELASYRDHLEELVAVRTAELERTYQRLQETQFAMNHAGIAIQWIDPADGHFIYVNSRACELYGYDQDELLHMQAASVVPEFQPARLEALRGNLRDNGRALIVSTARTRSGTPIPVETSVYLQVQADGQAGHYITFTTDITQRRLAEEALLSAKAVAEAAARTRSEFLANMSHEIRTPMNAIIGMSQLALHTHLEPKQRNYIEKVHLSAVSLLGILNDILDISKVEAGRLEIEHLEFMLEPVFNNLSNVISLRVEEKQLEFLLDIAPDVPERLIGDPMRLGQILINLVGNAVKFTEQGSVIVGCRMLPEASPDGGASVLLEFSVRDTGIGMDEAQLARLFSAFSQGDSSISRRFGGSGLGLNICKRLVELMGGKISVSSQPGVGSCFGFTARFAVAPVASMRRDVPESLHGRQVLVVDDNADAREILSAVIARFGLVVESAPSAAQALVKMSAKHYDLLVSDWKMPGMDGLQLIRHIQHGSDVNPPSAVVMVSAYSVEELRHEARDLLLAGVLAKPASPSSVFNAILGALGQAPLAAAIDEAPIAAEDYASLRGQPVLLVEDNAINQELANDLLSSVGMRVTIAGNGEEALSCLEKGEFACVLMDVQMPVMDGLEATRRIRQNPRFQSLPIIAMTAGALPEERAQTQEAGMNDHVTKPIDFTQLLTTIGRWVAAPPAAVPTGQAPAVATPPAAPTPADAAAQGQLDIEFGLKTALGKVSLYRRLLESYLEESLHMRTELATALHNGDVTAFTRLLHRLRGSSATVGLIGVSQAALALETACHNGNGSHEQLGDMFDHLGQTLDHGRQAVIRYLAPDSPGGQSVPSSGGV